MKNQNTLEEKRIWKLALKMTLSFTVSMVVIVTLISILARYFIFNGLEIDRFWIGSWAIFVTFFSIVSYFDFKKEITKIHENNNSNRTIG